MKVTITLDDGQVNELNNIVSVVILGSRMDDTLADNGTPPMLRDIDFVHGNITELIGRMATATHNLQHVLAAHQAKQAQQKGLIIPQMNIPINRFGKARRG